MKLNKKKKKPGRPNLEGESGESHRVTVRYSLDLWARICESAKQRKVSISNWFRQAAENELDRD